MVLQVGDVWAGPRHDQRGWGGRGLPGSRASVRQQGLPESCGAGGRSRSVRRRICHD